jgi:hypothetical protein
MIDGEVHSGYIPDRDGYASHSPEWFEDSDVEEM